MYILNILVFLIVKLEIISEITNKFHQNNLTWYEE
jgi:hypothetical protein